MIHATPPASRERQERNAKSAKSDAVGLLGHTLAGLGGDDVTPGQVAERLFRLTHDGVAQRIRFIDGAGHQFPGEEAGFLHQVKENGFRYLGRHDELPDGDGPGA